MIHLFSQFIGIIQQKHFAVVADACYAFSHQAARWSRLVHEGLNSAAKSAWEANTRVIAEISARGRRLYERLEGRLRADSMHRWVRINVDTGDYVVGDTFGDVDEQFRARFGEAPSWKTRVGEPPYVFRSARLLR